MNEEMRSATEELETSKEELQSVNEELTTVNHELKSSVEELSHTNADLNNLMASTDIGTIFLDRQLRIHRFTPSAQKIFNLIPADMGRPISDITSGSTTTGFIAEREKVLRDLHDDRTGSAGRRASAWLSDPHRALSHERRSHRRRGRDVHRHHAGVKTAEEELRESEARLRRAIEIETVGVIFFTLDGRITDTNDAFLKMSGYLA